MKHSKAKAMVGLLISTWPKPETTIDTQLAWEEVVKVERFEMEDWQAALAEMMDPPRAFCPHVSEVVARAVLLYHERLRESTPALPEETDDRPDCCKAEGGWTFRHWLDNHATDEEKAKAEEYGLGKRMEAASADG